MMPDGGAKGSVGGDAPGTAVSIIAASVIDAPAMSGLSDAASAAIGRRPDPATRNEYDSD